MDAPVVAQLAERRTVVCQLSLGRWFKSAQPESIFYLSPPTAFLQVLKSAHVLFCFLDMLAFLTAFTCVCACSCVCSCACSTRSRPLQHLLPFPIFSTHSTLFLPAHHFHLLALQQSTHFSLLTPNTSYLPLANTSHYNRKKESARALSSLLSSPSCALSKVFPPFTHIETSRQRD